MAARSALAIRSALAATASCCISSTPCSGSARSAASPPNASAAGRAAPCSSRPCEDAMKSRVLDVLKDRTLELGPPPAAGKWQHFKVERDSDGIAWILFDRAGKSANTLSGEVIEEFGDIVATLEKDLPKGVVVRSAKS